MRKQEPLDLYSVNMTHFELWNNLFSKDFLSIEESGGADIIPSTVYMKYALKTPYLMHQILATSAFHLSTMTKDSHILYREYATGLQNRALSLFHESNPVLELTPANCVHMFLFSSLVGVHLMCDILHYQRDSLEGFMDSFTHCLSVYRGVLAVMDQCGNLLYETDLGPRLKSSQILMQLRVASGSECDALWELVNAGDILPSSQNAYQKAILHLQHVFDAQHTASGNPERMPMIFVWPALVSSDYVDLLRQRQAEALIILAHYAVLLHRGRDLWLIGEGGKFLIESICESLGSDWQEWLEFPRAAIREGLVV